MTRIKAVFPAVARSFIEPHLPDRIDARWFTSAAEVLEFARDAEIGWFDLQKPATVGQAIGAGEKLKWVNTIYAGLDMFPLPLLARRGAVLTNGVGINTIAVAEYALAGILAAAKGFPEVMRAQERREWLRDSPGKIELFESRALVIGYGAIGSTIGDRLRAFGVDVTGVRRSRTDDPAIIGPGEWRARLGEFDWVVLAAPSTGETRAMLGAAELAAMKPAAWLINIARGDMIDQEALIEALRHKRIGGAFLDVTAPEPLPPESPLWELAIVTMHLSGRAQTRMFERATALFMENLPRYLAGKPMKNQVDLARGY